MSKTLTFANFFEFCSHLNAAGMMNPYVPFETPDHSALRCTPDCMEIQYGLIGSPISACMFTPVVSFALFNGKVRATRWVTGSEKYSEAIEDYAFDAPFCFSSTETDVTWWKDMQLDRSQYEFFRDMLGGLHAKLEREEEGSHEDPCTPYMTFRDFMNFVLSIRRDRYGVYQPFAGKSFALHIYDGRKRVNIAHLDEHNFPMAKVNIIDMDDGRIIMYPVRDGVTQYKEQLIYREEDPFCFGDRDHPITWWESVGLSSRDYENLRDMLGPYFGKVCAE